MDEDKRQLLMLRWLARDPWLTSAQMGAVLGCKAASAATYLGELKAKGWAQSLAPHEPDLPRERVYALTDEGLREMARVKGRTVAEMATCYKLSRATLIRMLNDLPHYWRIREHLLCKLAVHFGGLQVEWCWPRHFGQTFAFLDYHNKVCRLRPDCYGVVTAKGHCYPFFLIWDNGLTPMMLERRRVQPFEKAHYFDHFGFNFWTFPWVAIIASTPARAQQYRERLRTASSGSLRAFVIDQITLAQRHPMAPIWWRGIANTGFGQHDEDERVRMFDAATGIAVNEYRLNLGWDDPSWMATADLSGAMPVARRVMGSPLCRLAKRAMVPPKKKRASNVLGYEACLALGLRLSPPEKQALRLLGLLRVLTFDQLRRYFDFSAERCRRRLTHLMQLGLVLEVDPPMRVFLKHNQKLYVLTTQGLDMMARMSHQAVKRFRTFYGVALLEDGKRLLYERLIPHQLECVERMLAFHEAARAVTRAGQSCHALAHWSGERSAILVWRAQRYDKYGKPMLDKLRPDAYGVYSIGTKMGDFWLEVDRGKQMFRSSQWLDAGPYSFASKVRAYYDYVRHLELLNSRAPLPALLVVTKNQHRAAELRRVFLEVAEEKRFGALPLPIFVTTADRFKTHGPLAAIWQAPRADALTYCFMTLREAARAANGVGSS